MEIQRVSRANVKVPPAIAIPPYRLYRKADFPIALDVQCVAKLLVQAEIWIG